MVEFKLEDMFLSYLINFYVLFNMWCWIFWNVSMGSKFLVVLGMYKVGFWMWRNESMCKVFKMRIKIGK